MRKIFVLYILVNTGWISAVNAQTAWELLEPLDFQRGRLRSCLIDNMIYVFGGENTNGVYLDSVDVYNTETNEWTDLAPMPKGLIETNVGVINDMIYVIGGWSNVNLDYKTTNKTVAYDPQGGSWTVKENSPKATGSNAYCVLNDTIYILGGKEDFNSTDVKKAWFYDAHGDAWGTLPEMIYEHGAHGSACALDGKIYVIGGGTGLTLPMNPVQAERFNGEMWESIADLPVPVLHHFNVIHDNKILVFGGDSGSYSHDNGNATNLIQEYDPLTNTWSLKQGMPFARAAMTGQKVGNYVYLMGGYSNDRNPNTASTEVWRFNLDSLKVASGISNTSKNLISIFPNPVNDFLSVVTHNTKSFVFEVNSVNGQLILWEEYEGASRHIDLSFLQKGVYFITIRSEFFIATKKIIKL